MLNIRYITIILFFCTVVQGALAIDKLKSHIYVNGDLLVVVEQSTKEITTGDFLTLKIYAETIPGQQLIFPELSDMIELNDEQVKSGYKTFTIFRYEESASELNKNGKIVQVRSIVFAPGVSGEYLIQGFYVKSASASGEELSVFVMPKKVEVRSILPTDQKLQKLKPIISLNDKISSRNLWVFLALSITVLLLFSLIKIYNRRQVSMGREEELLSEFQDLRNSQPAVIIGNFERLIIDYFSCRYSFSESVASADALVQILFYEQKINSTEKATIINLFDSYNTLRFSKEPPTVENCNELCAKFADMIKSEG